MFITGPVVVRGENLRLDVDPSPERLRATVERLCTEFGPRSHEYTGNLDHVALWIADELQQAELRVELQEYEIDGSLFRNVIGRRPGSDPDAGSIVIGAHYDTVADTPGANDNASGVAVLLELTRTLPDVQPRRTHYFVAFSTEEPPFFDTDDMGSFVFARELQREGVDVLLMLSLDLVGYYSDEPGSQHFPYSALRLLYPGRANFVAVIGDARSGPAIGRTKRGMLAAGTIPVHSFRAPAGSGLVHLSDHGSFRRLNMPAVQVSDTAFMRYSAYHRADDVPEKLDYTRMAEVVRSLHGVLWEGTQPS
jgi:Zn-dependent M28 family amino/carboxypeptidase